MFKSEKFRISTPWKFNIENANLSLKKQEFVKKTKWIFDALKRLLYTIHPFDESHLEKLIALSSIHIDVKNVVNEIWLPEQTRLHHTQELQEKKIRQKRNHIRFNVGRFPEGFFPIVQNIKYIYGDVELWENQIVLDGGEWDVSKTFNHTTNLEISLYRAMFITEYAKSLHMYKRKTKPKKYKEESKRIYESTELNVVYFNPQSLGKIKHTTLVSSGVLLINMPSALIRKDGDKKTIFQQYDQDMATLWVKQIVKVATKLRFQDVFLRKIESEIMQVLKTPSEEGMYILQKWMILISTMFWNHINVQPLDAMVKEYFGMTHDDQPFPPLLINQRILETHPALKNNVGYYYKLLGDNGWFDSYLFHEADEKTPRASSTKKSSSKKSNSTDIKSGKEEID